MRKPNTKLHDIIGICSGVLLVLILVLNIVMSGQPAAAGASEIPDDAVTAEGTAPGRNGPITVSVTATEDTIYKIEVLSHEETEGIGTVAVEKLPGMIFDAQSLAVDAVAGATVTSDALIEAVRDALRNAGFDPEVFNRAVEAAAPVERTDHQHTPPSVRRCIGQKPKHLLSEGGY